MAFTTCESSTAIAVTHGRWICADPLAADSSHKTREGWRPKVSLDSCKKCKELWTYGWADGAVRHLRRCHFNPRKKDRNSGSEDRQKGGRASRQNWPPAHWLKLHGWVNKIQTEDAMREEVAALDAEVISSRSDESESIRPVLEMSGDLCGQQHPLHVPSSDGGDQPSKLSALCGESISAVQPATAMTMQHLALNPGYYVQTSPPMQTRPATYSLCAEPVLSTSSDGACDQDSEDSTQTIPDDQLVLKVENISRLARLEGHWFVDVDYEDSLLPQEFFGQLLLSNNTLSRLAERAQLHQGYWRVQWRSDTIPLARARPRSDYVSLVQLLDILCPTQDVIEWYACDAAYVLPESTESYHLCLGSACQSCVMMFAFGAPPACSNQANKTWTG